MDRIINCADYFLTSGEESIMLWWSRGAQQSWYCPASVWIPPAAARPCCCCPWLIPLLFCIPRLCSHLVPPCCHEPAAVWGDSSWVWQLPQSCPLPHPAVPLLFGQAKLQALPPAPSASWFPCLPTPHSPPQPCEYNNPWHSFDTMHHPLTQTETETWQKY